MSTNLATVAYIVATILFILSLGGLSNPETSRRGNSYGILGMAIAVLATVFGPRVTAAGIPWIVGALVQIAPPLGEGAEGRPNALILGLAVLALALTAINMFGGFAVTRRMLAMFRK